MKTYRNMHKDRKSSLLFITAIFAIIVLSLAFAASDIFSVKEGTPAAEAAYYAGQKIVNNVTLGSHRTSSEAVFSKTYTLTGIYADFYRRGMLNIVYNLDWTAYGAYHDFGSMALKAPGINLSQSWGRQGSTTKTLSANSPDMGGTGNITITYEAKAWEEMTWWPPAMGSIDTNFKIRTTITLLSDTKAPTFKVTNIKDENTWTQSKEITFSITDDKIGVDANTIKVNGVFPDTPGTENGRTVEGIKYTLMQGGNNNLTVTFADHFGNSATETKTIPKIDTTNPIVTQELYAESTNWTNQPIKLIARARDADSGLKTFAIGTDLEEYAVGTTAEKTHYIYVEANGNYSGYVVDHVNRRVNLTPYNVWFYDNVKPTINKVYYDDTWVNTDVTLYIKAEDALSGVDKVKIYYENRESEAEKITGEYTHRFVMPASYATTQYTIRVYDKAGNASNDVKVTPNIDITPPVISSPNLIGKNFDGDLVNAASQYSYSNIDVRVSFFDSGGSGLHRIKLADQEYPVLGDTQEFLNVITANTIDQAEYTIYLWDKAGNRSSLVIKPLKDDTTPEIEAIGLNDWSRESQNIQAKYWVGLSGGAIHMKTTSLDLSMDDKLKHSENSNIHLIPIHERFYDSNFQKVYQYYTRTNISGDGERFYHFKIVSGSGVSTPWLGINGAVESTKFIETANNALIESTGARTRIDITAPAVTVNRYLSNSVEITEDDFNKNTWIRDRVIAYYNINDGRTIIGNRTDGLDSSGIASIKYTVDDGDEITLSLSSTKYYGDPLEGNSSKGTFSILFTNNLQYTGESYVPTYRIWVTDNVGNVSEHVVINPKVDERPPTIELVSVEERIDPQTTIPYDWTREHQWTNNAIEFTFNITCGHSGVYIAYYIDEAKGIYPPQLTGKEWVRDYATSTGPLFPQTQTQTIVIPKVKSYDAVVFFSVLSGAKRPDENETRLQVTLGDRFFIAMDNDNPKIDGYEYRDAGGAVIDINAWSPSDVSLIAYTSDKSEHGAEGSGVREVYSTITGNVSIVEVTVSAGGEEQTFDVNFMVNNYSKVIYFEMIAKDEWKIDNLLSSIKSALLEDSSFLNSAVLNELNSLIQTDYPDIKSFIGGRDYSLTAADIGLINMITVRLENIDNVGLRILPPISAFIPRIDLIKPKFTSVISQNYENDKGHFDEHEVWIDAKPMNQRDGVRIRVSSEIIASGGRLYVIKRSVEKFIDERLSMEYKPGYVMLTKEMVYDLCGGENGYFESIIPNQAFNANIYIGRDVDLENVGVDFVIISGAGHISHIAYGAVFVDKQAPQLNVDQIIYKREDGGDASGVIFGEGSVGEWTNSNLTIHMYLTDNEGAGINESSVYISVAGNRINPASTDVDENGNGYYIFEGIDRCESHTLYFNDKPGNSNNYRFTPLIDRDPGKPAISLFAETADLKPYNINPNIGGGVKYIDKDIVIIIELQLGPSSFDITNQSYRKGDELYSLIYSVDGVEFNITEEMGRAEVWYNEYDQNVFRLEYHDRSMAIYKMELIQDQNRVFSFKVKNGVKDHNAIEHPDYPTCVELDYNPEVKIDQTPPEIRNVSYDKALDIWTADDITVSFELYDQFSGIRHDDVDSAELKSVVVVIRDTTINQNEIERYPLTPMGGVYSFSMNSHLNYYIEFEDQIGNGAADEYYSVVNGVVIGKEDGIFGPIKPYIDKHQPDFKKDGDEIVYSLISANQKYEGDWTNTDVYLTLTTSVGISGQKLQYQWKSLTASNWPSEEDSPTGWTDIIGESEYNGIIEPFSGLTEKSTRMDFINNQARIYRFRIISGAGLYSIFEEIQIKIDNVQPEIIVTSDYTPGEWANNNVEINIQAICGESGATIEYSIDSVTWTSAGDRYRGFLQPIQGENNKVRLNITESTTATLPPVIYYFRVVNGAKVDVTFTFGEVKIDRIAPSITNIRSSVSAIAPENVVYYPGTNEVNYASTWERATPISFGNWTKGYVIIRLQSVIGPSGGKVYYSTNVDGEEVIWQQDLIYNSSITVDNNLSYIFLTEDQNNNYSFRIISNSSLVATVYTNQNENIMIDNTIPTMDLTIEGQKSVKWTDDGVEDLHKWYTSAPIITFNVEYPISGAKVYYSYGGEEWDDRYILNNSMGGKAPTYTVSQNGIHNLRFKVVSGAGNEFILDEVYKIQIDTTDYHIDIEQWIKGYGSLPGVNLSEMADLVLTINQKAQAEVPIVATDAYTGYIAKKGDSISLEIIPKAYEGYQYHFKRAVFAGQEYDSEIVEYIDKDYVYEITAFDFEIFDKDYSIMAYFAKEIEIVYHNLYQIKQISEIKAVEITTDYAVEELEFTVYYNGSTVAPTEIGLYSIVVATQNDDPNDPNYIINNPDGNDLIIVYFKDYGEDLPLYHVGNYTDLSYIGIYSDPNPVYNFLGPNRIVSSYLQVSNFEIGNEFQPVYGDFKGSYNGNNFEIYLRDQDAIHTSGIFGIFESVQGVIRNLGIKLDTVIIDNAMTAGFLAAQADGAEISHVYAIGEFIISGENSNIGGLIGHTIRQTIVQNCYTDIAISNKGNQLSGNVGGLIGLMDDTALKFSYSLGAMEAYYIQAHELNIGQIGGSILSIMDGQNTLYGNKFLERNLFVNDQIKNIAFGYVESGLTITPSAVEALYFARFVDERSYLDVPGADNIAMVSIASRLIKDLAIGRIRDLGMEEGLGLPSEPFIIKDSVGLAFIDKYVWANYIQANEINLESGFKTIAAQKVFIGTYNGNMHRINNLVIDSQENITGFIGTIAGMFRNVDIRGIDITVNYTGTDQIYVGGIAGRILSGATVHTVYALGNVKAYSPYTKIYIGGISGYIEDATIVDILSLANVRTDENSYSVDIGGTAGFIKNVAINTAFSLARVQGNYQGVGSVGAAIGTVSGTNTIDNLYALIGNTFAHGQSYDYLAGYVAGSGLSENLIQPGDNNNQYIDFETLRGSPLRFDSSSKTLNEVLSDIYPLDGSGTGTDPFQVRTVEDFSYINDFLYAHYRIKANIDFTGHEFTTIGINAKFSGSISGAMTHQEYQEHLENGGTGRAFRLSGLTDALIYHLGEIGTIRDLRLQINYNKVSNTDLVFGAVAIYNSGTIQSVNSEGYISVRVLGNKTAIVGGFVGIDLGGYYIQGEQGEEYQVPSRELSSINNTVLSIAASTINVGGFVGRVVGPTELSYIISDADIICTGGSISAGTIAGTVLSGGVTYDHQIEDTAARVYINGIENTKQYGFNINDL
ncbi:MAG: hypothetical protein WBM21_02000 [Christensenellales bacterium]